MASNTNYTPSTPTSEDNSEQEEAEELNRQTRDSGVAYTPIQDWDSGFQTTPASNAIDDPYPWATPKRKKRTRAASHEPVRNSTWADSHRRARSETELTTSDNFVPSSRDSLSDVDITRLNSPFEEERDALLRMPFYDGTMGLLGILGCYAESISTSSSSSEGDEDSTPLQVLNPQPIELALVPNTSGPSRTQDHLMSSGMGLKDIIDPSHQCANDTSCVDNLIGSSEIREQAERLYNRMPDPRKSSTEQKQLIQTPKSQLEEQKDTRTEEAVGHSRHYSFESGYVSGTSYKDWKTSLELASPGPDNSQTLPPTSILKCVGESSSIGAKSDGVHIRWIDGYVEQATPPNVRNLSQSMAPLPFRHKSNSVDISDYVNSYNPFLTVGMALEDTRTYGDAAVSSNESAATTAPPPSDVGEPLARVEDNFNSLGSPGMINRENSSSYQSARSSIEMTVLQPRVAAQEHIESLESAFNVSRDDGASHARSVTIIAVQQTRVVAQEHNESIGSAFDVPRVDGAEPAPACDQNIRHDSSFPNTPVGRVEPEQHIPSTENTPVEHIVSQQNIPSIVIHPPLGMAKGPVLPYVIYPSVKVTPPGEEAPSSSSSSNRVTSQASVGGPTRSRSQGARHVRMSNIDAYFSRMQLDHRLSALARAQEQRDGTSSTTPAPATESPATFATGSGDTTRATRSGNAPRGATVHLGLMDTSQLGRTGPVPARTNNSTIGTGVPIGCLPVGTGNYRGFRTNNSTVGSDNPSVGTSSSTARTGRSIFRPWNWRKDGTNNSTVGTDNSPVVSSNLPTGTSNSPIASINLPIGTSNSPIGTSNPPVASSNLPIGTSNLPTGTSNLPIGTSNPPAASSNRSVRASSPTAKTNNSTVGAGNSIFGTNSSIFGPDDSIIGAGNSRGVRTNDSPIGTSDSTAGSGNPSVGTSNPPIGTNNPPIASINLPTGTGNPPAGTSNHKSRLAPAVGNVSPSPSLRNRIAPFLNQDLPQTLAPANADDADKDSTTSQTDRPAPQTQMSYESAANANDTASHDAGCCLDRGLQCCTLPKCRTCSCIVMMTKRLPSPPPGLDIWVDGVSNRKTLEMLGYMPDDDEMTMAMESSSKGSFRPQVSTDTVVNCLLKTSPSSVHLSVNGGKRSSQVADNSEDYAFVRRVAGAGTGDRYWVLDIEDVHCVTCCNTIRNQRRRDFDTATRLKSRAKGAWRHQHCMNSYCHAACEHERRVSCFVTLLDEEDLTLYIQPHHVLSRLGLETTHKIKYVRLTSTSPCMDPDILASVITVLKPFLGQLEGLEVNIASSSPSDGSKNSRKTLSRQEARRFVCCFVELEKMLVGGARLKIGGLEGLDELVNMWWDVRRKWWMGVQGV
ncbi:hypothetical protein SBOR_6877 [Sclerotinia borealis F-4128]|uniref:Uncharacterized protein n=1 Tax=Sclerotinia borealis (strain F-4128) TaxID=1432307 RepID=W9C7G3_SCLBF|nr:hypothetical protein SBOR_6877 [Sclerotinia borealis F-4128]